MENIFSSARTYRTEIYIDKYKKKYTFQNQIENILKNEVQQKTVDEIFSMQTKHISKYNESDTTPVVNNLSADYNMFTKNLLANNYTFKFCDFHNIETIIYQLKNSCEIIRKTTRIAPFNSNLPVLNISKCSNTSHSISSTCIKKTKLFSALFGMKNKISVPVDYKKSNTKLTVNDQRYANDKFSKKSVMKRRRCRKNIYKKKHFLCDSNKKEIDATKPAKEQKVHFNYAQFELEIVRNLEQILNSNDDLDNDNTNTNSQIEWFSGTPSSKIISIPNIFVQNYQNLLYKNVEFMQNVQVFQKQINQEQKELTTLYLRQKFNFKKGKTYRPYIS